jgi:hypothetical protein
METVVEADTGEATDGSPRAALPSSTDASEPSLTAAVANTLSEIIDAVVEVDRVIAGLAATRARLLDQANEWSATGQSLLVDGAAGSEIMRQRALRAEVACALRIPERTAENLLANSRILARDLPATLRALGAGEISYRHAEMIVDQTAGLEPDARASLERAALPFARNLTAAKFERKLRSLRELANPESMVERKEHAVVNREVVFSPARDGMAWLSAYLPAADALAAYNRLTAIARELRGTAHTAEEERTLPQLRADVLRDLLLDGEPALEGHHGIRPKVFVTVPVLTLLGHGLADGTAAPGMLDGYGPIDAETARELAANAPSFIRLLTHPETGAILSVGRDSYRVPQDLKNWLQIRDGTCRFPGCSRHSSQCEIDHTEDWAHDGQTRHDNLAHLCLSHHRLKHNTAWRMFQSDPRDGSMGWISPAGRSYTTEAETQMPRSIA